MNRLTRGRKLVDLVAARSSTAEQCAALDENTGEFRFRASRTCSREQGDSSGDETMCDFSDLESIEPSDSEYVVED